MTEPDLLAWTSPADGDTAPVRATLLLLHGITDSGACWADLVPRLTAVGLGVVAVDARGHGRSPRWTPEQLDAPGDVMVDDVLALLSSLSLPEPVVLVGHSMGAAVAVAAAASTDLRGAGVVAVVAEDPPWPLPPRTGPDPELAERWLTGWADDAALGVPQLAERIAADNPGWPVAELEPCAVAKGLVQRELLAAGDIVPRRPWPELVTDLRVTHRPLLLVTGDRDVRITDESERVARDAGARVVRIPGAGHCVRRDAGDAYLTALLAFLDDVLP